MSASNIIDSRIIELGEQLAKQKERTLSFIVDLVECGRVYRSIEDLSLQIKTLENLRAAIILEETK